MGLATLLLTTGSAAAQENLVAEPYPGAVKVHFWGEETELDRDQGFYAKEDVSEVRNHYEQRHGPMSEGALSGQESGIVYSRPLMSRQEVRSFVSILPEPAGIVLRALDPERHTAPYAHRVVEPFFEQLRQVVALGDADREEYEAAEERFRHLAWSYFQLTDQRNESGERLATDEIILRECRSRQQQGMDEEELAAELQRLYMAGKFEEAQQLSESVGGMGSWDHWIDCLERLEEEAYKTLMVIHKHPSLWDE